MLCTIPNNTLSRFFIVTEVSWCAQCMCRDLCKCAAQNLTCIKLNDNKTQGIGGIRSERSVRRRLNVWLNIVSVLLYVQLEWVLFKHRQCNGVLSLLEDYAFAKRLKNSLRAIWGKGLCLIPLFKKARRIYSNGILLGISPKKKKRA